jgi:YD repeat-containing protein
MTITAGYGNGLDNTYTWSPTTGRIQSITTSNSAGTALSIGYTWDQLGNLSNRNDATHGLNESYGYDQLSRLTSVTLNGGSENSFAYDLLADMVSKADVGTYAYRRFTAKYPWNGECSFHCAAAIQWPLPLFV